MYQAFLVETKNDFEPSGSVELEEFYVVTNYNKALEFVDGLRADSNMLIRDIEPQDRPQKARVFLILESTCDLSTDCLVRVYSNSSWLSEELLKRIVTVSKTGQYSLKFLVQRGKFYSLRGDSSISFKKSPPIPGISGVACHVQSTCFQSIQDFVRFAGTSPFLEPLEKMIQLQAPHRTRYELHRPKSPTEDLIPNPPDEQIIHKTVELSMPAITRIIGIKGKNINFIRKSSQAHVKVCNIERAIRLALPRAVITQQLLLTGTQPQVKMAEKHIFKILNSYRSGSQLR
ncbi:unnamed protein product [Kuraishia capsulata CBS 1993]|uniref:K Homology domain-containing protein n=1 Tax=Kuraishia capsulata CBS 1993 TaxID=1382522 RepID=W6MUA9_9ASCO|nr:uncharacterized protein KUCA_T00005054001 [Kuraishia capsulata CBS 1993]CDK29067.1 unnamed protein product [Kuraishia capsulata CBS 1993]